MRRCAWLVLVVIAATPAGCRQAPPQSAPAPPPPDQVVSSVPTPEWHTNAVMELCRPRGQLAPEFQQQAVREVSAVVQKAGTPAAIQSQLSDWLGPDSVAVGQADADGDGFADLLITWARCGLPMMVYRHAAPDQPVLLPPGSVSSWGPMEGSRIDQVGDINGDGRPEVVASRIMWGGSGTMEVPYIWQWRDGDFATLFTASVISWRGRNRWEAGAGFVSIQCRPMGPFQHKLSPHRQLTEVFRWRPGAGAYGLTDRTWEPVTTQLHQIDVAERLLYAGRYDDARRAYLEVERYPADTMDAAAWVPFSRWRVAQIDALLGRRAEALAALERGAAEPYPLGDLARVFREAYEQADAAGGFAAVWQYLRKAATPDTWPYLFDSSNIAARPVLEDAFRRAGRPLPADLPEAPHLDPADCMMSHG